MTNNLHPPGPLAGIRVLDLTWVLAGPYAAMILCDLGAEVVKVERPPHGDVARTTGPFVNNESMYFQSVNRGKRSISIDLRSDEGRELFLRLVDQADVVMENFTPGVMDKLGIGPDALARAQSTPDLRLHVRLRTDRARGGTSRRSTSSFRAWVV